MIELAQATNSVADMDGDGLANDELVYQLSRSSAGFDEEFTDYVTTAVDQLVNSITFTDRDDPATAFFGQSGVFSISDFNSDGFNDLMVPVYGSTPLVVY